MLLQIRNCFQAHFGTIRTIHWCLAQQDWARELNSDGRLDKFHGGKGHAEDQTLAGVTELKREKYKKIIGLKFIKISKKIYIFQHF